MDSEQSSERTVPVEVLSALRKLRRPVIVGHVTPDADCLGSMGALARAWPLASGGSAELCLPAGTVSRRLGFLVAWAAAPVVEPEGLAAADGFIIVDTARKARCNVGPMSGQDWAAGRPVVNIDHHQSNDRFGQAHWVVPEASSAAELVYDVIRSCGWPMTPPVASLLYAGLHADTRAFTLASTGARSMAVATALLEAGADVAEVGRRLYRSLSRGELSLLRVIYANTRLVAGARIAYSTASQEEIGACGCVAADIDEQVEVPRSVEGIAMALLFTEGNRGRTRINLRGEQGTSVLPLAEALGGGGHDQAAGVVLECGLEEALARVLPLAEQHLTDPMSVQRVQSDV